MSAPATEIDPADVRAAAARLRDADRVLVVTGAGISAESGISTFRGPEGLWRRHRPEDLATAEAFARDPAFVWEWYEWRRRQVLDARPNRAHLALAAFEARAAELMIATQNVDGLHAAAGSRRVLELHGSLWTLRCVTCGVSTRDARAPIASLPPRCDCGGLLRPGVVWFGEALPHDVLAEASLAACRADVVVVIGTSSVVYPAASLPEKARARGAFVIEVNPEVTALTGLAHVSLRGTAVECVPALLGEAS
jgi:NAD-dependent deacetylase